MRTASANPAANKCPEGIDNIPEQDIPVDGTCHHEPSTALSGAHAWMAFARLATSQGCSRVLQTPLISRQKHEDRKRTLCERT